MMREMDFLKTTAQQAWMTIASDTGGYAMGAAEGPFYLQHQLSKKIEPTEVIHLFAHGQALKLTEEMKSPEKLLLWLETSRRQSEALSHLLFENDKAVLFSAEHSLALGNLAGLRARYPKARIGVVWIDAHADLHSPGTSPSMNPHGMPLAAAMNLDHANLWRRDLDFQTYDVWKDLQSLMMNNPVLPEDLVYVGLRDFEEEELQVIAEQKIKVFSVEDVRRKTTARLGQSIQRQLQQCDLIYLSFDVDALDAVNFSATGLPVCGGLRLQEVHDLLRELLQDSRVKTFEITELHPELGTEFQRRQVLQSLTELLQLWQPQATQSEMGVTI
jgi:arginase